MKEENSKTLNPQQHLPILGSIVDYLERHGFPKSAKSLLKSEPGIENGGWKTRAPKLEDMFGNYLEKPTSVEAVTNRSKKQDDVALKKKESNQSDAISQSVVDNSSIKPYKAPSDGRVPKQLADESDLKQDRKRKRTTKSSPGAVDSKPGRESQSQVDGKPKDKKKKTGSSDCLVETTEQFKVDKQDKASKKTKKSKGNRKQKNSDSDEALADRVVELTHQDKPTTKEISEDAVDKQDKVSKKKSRRASDTKGGKHVEELATDELKHRTTKATKETKRQEVLGQVSKRKKKPEPTAAVEGRPGVNYIVLKEGTPGGTRACNGQQVSIKYICTVKDSGAIICSNMCSAPWQFKLGFDEQKKDLHDGILGMQVGEKRRIDTFSSFARSGNDGERNVVVYDVELLDVN